ncbi:MAG: discoidin domain-containing protein [Armatimonadota bacterium]
MKRAMIVPILISVCLLAALPALAGVWSAFSDYNPYITPTPWSYVYQLGGQWDGSYTFSAMEPYTNPREENIWHAPGTVSNYPILEVGDDPALVTSPEVGVVAEWGRLKVESCKVEDTALGLSAGLGFVCFTAPKTGSYTFSGDVYTYCRDTETIDVTPWVKCERYGALFTSTPITVSVTAGGPVAPFTFTKDLAVGDKIYFGCDITTGRGDYQYVPLYWTINVVSSENNLAVTPSGGTATVSASSRLNTSSAALKAVDNLFTTSSCWKSLTETWTVGNADPYSWWKVEWTVPQTFNEIDIYPVDDANYYALEYAIDIWNAGTSSWNEIAYGKKIDNALRDVFLFAAPVQTSKLRYRTVVPNAFIGAKTKGGLTEIQILNNVDTSKWTTITGTIKDSAGISVAGAHTFVHVSPGATPSRSDSHLVGSRSDSNGTYSITFNTDDAARIGGDKLCVYALGQSMSALDPSTGVATVAIAPVPGGTSSVDVNLPGPAEAYTTLGDVAGRTSLWMTQTLDFPTARTATQTWYTIPTTMGSPSRACDQISDGINDGLSNSICFNVPPEFAQGSFDKMYVTIDYYDTGISGMQLTCAPTSLNFNGPWVRQGSGRIRKEGTDTWRSQTVVLNDSIMRDWFVLQNDTGAYERAMFSIDNLIDGNAPVGVEDNYIAKVAMHSAPASVSSAPSVTFGTVGAPGQHPALRCDDKGLHPRFAPALPMGSTDLGTIIEDVEGTARPGYQTTGSNRQAIWLDIDDNYLFGVVPDLYVTVEYFDDASYSTDTIDIGMYSATDGWIKQSIQKSGSDGSTPPSNTWETATLHFQNVRVNNAFDELEGYQGTGDIRIHDNSNDDIIGKVSIATTNNVIPVNTIAAAKAAANNTTIVLPAKTVTGNFGSFFYIEEDDRTSGIRVNATTSAVAGQKVVVSGTLTSVNGEYVIQDASVGTPAASAEIGPLGTANKNLDGAGLSTLGLLVKVWGAVTTGSGTNNFEITDGSGASLKVSAPAGYSAPAGGVFVNIKGVCGMQSASTLVIWVDDAANIN